MMVQGKLTFASPTAESTVNNIIKELQQIDSHAKTVACIDSELSYEILLPTASNAQVEAVGDMFKEWLNGWSPGVLGNQLFRDWA